MKDCVVTLNVPVGSDWDSKDFKLTIQSTEEPKKILGITVLGERVKTDEYIGGQTTWYEHGKEILEPQLYNPLYKLWKNILSTLSDKGWDTVKREGITIRTWFDNAEKAMHIIPPLDKCH